MAKSNKLNCVSLNFMFIPVRILNHPKCWNIWPVQKREFCKTFGTPFTSLLFRCILGLHTQGTRHMLTVEKRGMQVLPREHLLFIKFIQMQRLKCLCTPVSKMIVVGLLFNRTPNNTKFLRYRMFSNTS